MGDTKGEIKLSGYFVEVQKKKDFRDAIAVIQDIRKINYLRDKESGQRYMIALDELCDSYGFPRHPWWDIFEQLVIEGIDAEIDLTAHRYGSCRVRDHDMERGMPSSQIEWINEAYPISISISPYATIEEVRDFIDNNTPYLKSLLETFQRKDIPLHSYKKRLPKKVARDDFLFQHRDMPYKDLMSLYNDTCENDEDKLFNYDQVGKIIRREKERRGFD
jgi:hypothetical protein